MSERKFRFCVREPTESENGGGSGSRGGGPGWLVPFDARHNYVKGVLGFGAFGDLDFWLFPLETESERDPHFSVVVRMPDGSMRRVGVAWINKRKGDD